ncbi:hypothetical protein GCM10023237_21860 [Streptomyces coeruleoprunus]
MIRAREGGMGGLSSCGARCASSGVRWQPMRGAAQSPHPARQLYVTDRACCQLNLMELVLSCMPEWSPKWASDRPGAREKLAPW